MWIYVLENLCSRPWKAYRKAETLLSCCTDTQLFVATKLPHTQAFTDARCCVFLHSKHYMYTMRSSNLSVVLSIYSRCELKITEADREQ